MNYRDFFDYIKKNNTLLLHEEQQSSDTDENQHVNTDITSPDDKTNQTDNSSSDNKEPGDTVKSLSIGEVKDIVSNEISEWKNNPDNLEQDDNDTPDMKSGNVNKQPLLNPPVHKSTPPQPKQDKPKSSGSNTKSLDGGVVRSGKSKKKSKEKSKDNVVIKNPVLQQTRNVPKHQYVEYKELIPINVPSGVENLTSFYDKNFQSMLSKLKSSFCVISLCSTRSISKNMNLSQIFVEYCMRFNFTYIPVYVLNQENKIIDILFFVFMYENNSPELTNLTEGKGKSGKDEKRGRNFIHLFSFISFIKRKFGVDKYLINEFGYVCLMGNNLKYQYHNNQYQNVLISYLKVRGLDCSGEMKLMVNKQPCNEDYYKRTNNNEICVPSVENGKV